MGKATPTEREVADAYAWAMAHAALECPHNNEAAEYVRDAATDGVMWARDHYDPAAGDWRPFVRRSVRVCVRRAINRYRANEAKRGVVYSLPPCSHDSADHDARGGRWFDGFALAAQVTDGGPVPMPPAVRDLPPDLRDAVRLFYIDRFDLRDCGLLLGVGHDTVRQRLNRAARMLAADDARRPARPCNTRRVKH